MRIHRWTLASLGLLAGFATLSASSSRPSPAAHPGTRPAALPAAAPLRVSGIRGTAPSPATAGARLDGALSDLVRHVGRARPDHELADLHALSPAARFRRLAGDAGPLVLVDAVTRRGPPQLKGALI